MNNVFMPRFLTAEEKQVLLKNVKHLLEHDGISIEDLAEGMERPVAFVKDIVEGKRILTYDIVDDLATSFDVLPEYLLYACGTQEDEEAATEYVAEIEDEDSSNIAMLKILLNDCDISELCFLNHMLPILGDEYRNTTCPYFTIKYDSSWEPLSREEAIESILNYVEGTTTREEVFFINAIELSIKQIRMDLGANYIPFPSMRIDPNLTALLYVVDYQNESEVFPNNYSKCISCPSLAD